jgi:uncharacterized protein with HEPN domain
MKRDPRVYLDDILDAMNKAEMFVAGMSYEQFENVNLRIVWDVVKRDIPQVRPLIEQILTDLEDRSPTGPGTA